MSTRPFTKFAIAGGSGNLGTRVFKTLTEKGFDVVSLSRSSRGGSVAVSYDDEESLLRALRGREVVINLLGQPSLASDSQLRLATAAAKAGVKLFVPNDWGADLEAVVQRNDPPIHPFIADKATIKQQVEELGMSWLGIDNGLFGSYLPILTQADAKAKTATIAGPGDTKFTLTDEQDIAQFLANAFATLSKDDLTNKQLRVSGASVTFNEIFNKAGYTLTHLDAQETKERSQDLSLGGPSFYAWLLYAIHTGSDHIEHPDNERVGLTHTVTDPTALLAASQNGP